MVYCLNGLTLPDYNAIQNNTDMAVIRVSKEVQSGSKIIKMIAKQHYITSIDYSGKAFFDINGRLSLKEPKPSFKYKIEYDNCIDGKECIWCFN